MQIIDVHDRPGEFSQVRDLRTCEPVRLVGNLFEGTTIDTNFWTSTVSGAGAANAQVSGKVTLASGTANSGFAQMQSVRKGRFIFANPHVFRAAILIPTVAVAQNTRRWGAFTTSSAPTPTDGFYFELAPDGTLSVNARNAGGTVTSVSSGSFNGEVSGFTVDTNVHVYEIHYYVMGVEFFVDGVLLHELTPTTANLSSLYTLPITVNSANSASGTTSGTIELWATNMMREGKEHTVPKYFNITGNAATWTLKLGAGVLHKLIFNNTSGTSFVIYDNTTGAAPAIGTITTAAASLGVWDMQVPFFTGLVIVTSGNNLDMTVVYE